MSLEQKQRAEQLYHQLGLDPIVNQVLREFSRSLSGMDRAIDKIFGPYDIKGRAREAAKLTALITHDSINEEYHQKAAKLEAQIKSLEIQRDKERNNYDNLVQKVTDIVRGDYDRLKANYYELNDRLAELRNLSHEMKTLLPILNIKEKAHPAQSYESQIVDGDSKTKLLDSEKTNLIIELERLKSNYEGLMIAITTLAWAIPYDEIREKLGHELYSFFLKDTGLLDKRINSAEKHIDFQKYLRIAAEKGAKEASEYVEETLRKVVKNKIHTEEIDVIFCMRSNVVSGSICHLEGQRLSDILNDLDQRSWTSGPYLELNNVNLRTSHEHKEILPTAHIKKADVLMAVLLDINGARGVGAKDGPKTFPFVPKYNIPVELHMKDYMLIGKMYCALGQKAQDVIDETPRFLPIKDVSIRPIRDNIEVTVPFAVINKEQISLFSN